MPDDYRQLYIDSVADWQLTTELLTLTSEILQSYKTIAELALNDRVLLFSDDRVQRAIRRNKDLVADINENQHKRQGLYGRIQEQEKSVAELQQKLKQSKRHESLDK